MEGWWSPKGRSRSSAARFALDSFQQLLGWRPILGGKQTYLAFDHPRFQETPNDARLQPVLVRPLDEEAR
eukprot:8882994-Pyramimonas_sp.AAC.1